MEPGLQLGPKCECLNEVGTLLCCRSVCFCVVGLLLRCQCRILLRHVDIPLSHRYKIRRSYQRTG